MIDSPPDPASPPHAPCAEPTSSPRSCHLIVVLLSWDAARLAWLRRALQTLAPCCRAATLVIHTPPQRADELASLPVPVTPLWTGANIGFAAGVNRALTAVDTPFVLLLNPDALPRPGFAQRALSQLEADPAVGAVTAWHLDPQAGPVSHLRTLPQPSQLLLEALGLERFARTLGASPARSGCWIPFACAMLRTATLRRLGGLDDRFFLFWEDVDFAARLHVRGGKTSEVAAALVEHDEDTHRKYHDERKLWAWHRGAILFAEKHWGRAIGVLVRAAMASRALLRLGWWSLAWPLGRLDRAQWSERVRGYVRVLLCCAGWSVAPAGVQLQRSTRRARHRPHRSAPSHTTATAGATSRT